MGTPWTKYLLVAQLHLFLGLLCLFAETERRGAAKKPSKPRKTCYGGDASSGALGGSNTAVSNKFANSSNEAGILEFDR